MPQAQFDEPRVLPWIPAYGGCKSWIDLAEPIAIADSTPILSEPDYAYRVVQVREALGQRECDRPLSN